MPGIQTNIGNTVQPITGVSKGIDISGSDFAIDVPTDASALNQTNTTSFKGGNNVSGAGVASAGLSALSSVPGLIAAANINPAETGQTREEVKALVKAQNAMYIKSGMEIGGSIGSIWGPIGTLIGTAVGGVGGWIGGDTQKGKAINKFNLSENDEVNAEWIEAKQERDQNYFDTTSAKNMEAELRLMKQQQGFIT